MADNLELYRKGHAAVTDFCRHVSNRGWFRIIRDPEGTISIWDILDTKSKPFSVTFVDRGKSSLDLKQMSPEYVNGLVQCLYKETGSRK